jgi:two-component system LytT family response regulator
MSAPFLESRHESMKKLRILIVDDEPLARARIRSLLGDDSSVEIIGECANGIEALAAIRREGPEIVFLDVQMPGCGGLELLAELPPEKRPAVILATAHDRFAVEAFSAQVVDYLLKPFGRERFRIALKRAVDHIDAQRAGSLAARIEGILDSPQARPSRLLVKSGGRMIFIAPSDIVWVEADNNYCVLNLANSKRLMIREKLSSLEKRLGASCAVRVNRSALVHVDQVQELLPGKYGDHVVLLRNGVRLPLSRSLRGRFEKLVTSGP